MGLRIPDSGQTVSNPRLGFRLDPGEPGVLRSASASQSTLRVAEQEGRNTRRLEAAAQRDGRIVTRSVRQFTRADTGSFLATRAGRTIVESVEPRPTPVENALAIAEAREAVAPAPEPGAAPATAPPLGGTGSTGLFNGGFRFADAESAEVEVRLIAQQAALERALVQQAGTVADVDDPEAVAAAQRDLAQLRQQAQQIEQEINRIRLARVIQGNQQLTRALLGAVEAQAANGAALAGAAAGTGLGAQQPDTEFLNLIA